MSATMERLGMAIGKAPGIRAAVPKPSNSHSAARIGSDAIKIALWKQPRAPVAAVTVERLTIDRGGQQVLRDISVSFAEGTITAIVGPSGAGKTTLMGALNGLLPPASGTVSVEGIGGLAEAKALHDARRRTATIFQDHALIGRLPAIDNVLLGLADARHPLSLLPWPRSLRIRAAQALDDVGLLSRATARTSELSGGERQRVGIARALVRRPRLLLGDEPFASVDPALARRLSEEFRRLVAIRGVTVILVLHQLQLARTLADRIVGLANGQVAFDGAAASFDAAAEEKVFSAIPTGAGPHRLPPQEKEALCYAN
jgi:phosphonate transport system ATP-binding protein